MQRAQLLQAFIKTTVWQDADLTPLKQDASKRRYFRLTRHNKTALVMDAPPPYETTQPFVDMTYHLQKLGMRVPDIMQHDVEHGFILLEDLGNDTFTRLLANGESELALYQQALESILHLQAHKEATNISVAKYDFNALFREAELFIQWYLPFIRQKNDHIDNNDQKMTIDYQQTWQSLYQALPNLPDTLVLRDFHIDNVMRVDSQCAVIDYQDALIGSPAYDLISLIEDARRDVSQTTYLHIVNQYLAKSDYDESALMAHLHFWACQRHLKVAGIFARLYLRDEKPQYLMHLPRVIRLLKSHLETPALAPLAKWINHYCPDIYEPVDHLINSQLINEHSKHQPQEA